MRWDGVIDEMTQVRMRHLGPGEYAAEVDEGEQTTHHRVVVTRGLVDDLEIPDVAEERVVRESLGFLLERLPNTSLPHDIDLDAVSRTDGDYVPELQRRLAS